VYMATTFHTMIIVIPGLGRMVSHLLLELMLKFLRSPARQWLSTAAINDGIHTRTAVLGYLRHLHTSIKLVLPPYG
jgi:hypothetical protein